MICSYLTILQETEDFSELIKTVGLKRLLTGMPYLHGKVEDELTIIARDEL